MLRIRAGHPDIDAKKWELGSSGMNQREKGALSTTHKRDSVANYAASHDSPKAHLAQPLTFRTR